MRRVPEEKYLFGMNGMQQSRILALLDASLSQETIVCDMP